jgi:hypothetical protein
LRRGLKRDDSNHIVGVSERTAALDQCLVSKVQTIKVANGYYGPDTFFAGPFTWPVADDFHV